MDLRPEFTTLRAYGVIRQGDQVLLCRLGPDSDDPGLWTLPGGGGDYGESPEETCHREMMEETGLLVSLAPFPLVDSRLFENAKSRVQSVRFLYRASIVGGELRNETDGSTDLATWVPISEVATIRKADIVELAMAML